MLYLNKFLSKIKENPAIFKTSNIIMVLGLTATHIKNLKKYALENQLISQSKQWYFLTEKGEEYLSKNPIKAWKNEKFSLRPSINVEYLKEEKIPSVLTKALRLVAKYLLENQQLKENSIEYALFCDIEKCNKLEVKISEEILSNKRVSLEKIFEKYFELGITKSLISLVVLDILVKNSDKIAIYEKSQFQLKFDQLMFDRMVACPENFEIQKTEMPDEYLLKDISKIILNKKSNNILEITKGLYKFIKSLDKYTMNTQNLNTKTLRLRNIIVNAKDPISLFERDIPKALSGKLLQDCDREFLDTLKKSLDELRGFSEELVKEIKIFIFENFNTKSKEDLSRRFTEAKAYLNEKELKILFNSISDTEVNEDLWVNRIATFINKSRVPKDWSDEDFADFKLKTKELALKFLAIEATLGINNIAENKSLEKLLNNFVKLTKPEQMIFLRNAVNKFS